MIFIIIIQAIPHAIATVRATDKKSPREAVEFVLQLLKVAFIPLWLPNFVHILCTYLLLLVLCSIMITVETSILMFTGWLHSSSPLVNLNLDNRCFAYCQFRTALCFKSLRNLLIVSGYELVMPFYTMIIRVYIMVRI